MIKSFFHKYYQFTNTISPNSIKIVGIGSNNGVNIDKKDENLLKAKYMKRLAKSKNM